LALRVESWLLVENYEEVKRNENEGRVLEDGRATEKPCLTEQSGQNAVVHRVTGVTVKTAYDEMPRWIDWRQCALAPGKEVPDAAKQDDDTDYDENARCDGSKTKSGKVDPSRCEEYSIGHVAGDHSRQKCHEEHCSDREKGPHRKSGVRPVWLLAKPSQPALHEILEMCKGSSDGRLRLPHLIRAWIDNVCELYRASSPVVLHAQMRFIAREIRDAAYQDDVHGRSGEKRFGIR
jgi:hypothetical protein